MSDRAHTAEPAINEVVLLTGLFRPLARHLALAITSADPEAQVIAIASEDDADAGRELEARAKGQVRLLRGQVDAMDLGLAGSEYTQVVETVTTIHHLASAPSGQLTRERAESLHLGGTRNVLALAAECRRLRRLVHWSSTCVAGRRRGVVLEDELDTSGFHNVHEETLHGAEKLVRQAMQRLPVTVLRPSAMVCDSRSGEIDWGEPLAQVFAMIAGARGTLPVPIPASSTAPVHMVPVDFAAAAGYALSMDPRAANRTFHLSDPHPLPARRVFELIAEHAHTRVTRRSLPTGLAKTLLRAPGLERLARAPRTFLDSLDQQIYFNTLGATERLSEAGLFCPSFPSYVGTMALRLREKHRSAGPPDGDVTTDPFDG